MSADEQIPAPTIATDATDAVIEQERSEKILQAKELYSHGSRNYLVKSYAEAADELSQVCALYGELYGELSDELGMPYLLYAKSLIALALDENKVIDVPDQEDDEDDDEDDEVDNEGVEASEVEANGEAAASSSAATNGSAAKLQTIKEVDGNKKSDEADSTANDDVHSGENSTESKKKNIDEAQVSSTDNGNADTVIAKNDSGENGTKTAAPAASVVDGEKPSTSNGDVENVEEEEDENEAASSLQLAWEILELAAKIFTRQGLSGLPNLAEVQTELGNIEFENNILDAAREDYEKALKIYKELPTSYRRIMAEIHYKIGLTHLMQALNKEGAESLKQACTLIEAEIEEIKAKNAELSEKDKNNIQDMEETKQEIWAKITEIEEAQVQQIADVRAALDNYIKPISSDNVDGVGPSSSLSSTTSATASGAASSITSSSKPTDISHLIKRKKPEEPNSEAEAAAASPAKRPAV